MFTPTLPHLSWSGLQIKPIQIVLNLLFFLVWRKLSGQGQAETWTAVECGSWQKKKGQPGPGTLKASNPTYSYRPQSNLPNILVKQAGFKPIFCLLFSLSDKYPHQTEIQSLSGSTSSVHLSFGGKCPSPLVVAQKRKVLESIIQNQFFKRVFSPYSLKKFSMLENCDRRIILSNEINYNSELLHL